MSYYMPMNPWKKIFAIAFVLVGGTASFGIWSISQFEKAFSQMEVKSDTQRATAISIVSSAQEVISSSTIAIDQGTSTLVSTTTIFNATTSDQVASTTVSVFEPKDFSLTFPTQGKILYTGCTYDISWASSTRVDTFNLWLVDSDKIEKLRSDKSGLYGASSTPFIGKMIWKVGDIVPGSYYILISKIDGVDVTYRSEKFIIKNKATNNTSSIDVCSQ